MTFLLCIDTTLRGVSAAIVNTEDANAVHPAWVGAHLDVMSSASQISELVAQGLRDARISVTDIEGVAVSTGPGSFTGIKIGLSFAAGFTFAARDRCGILGLSSLECAVSTLATRAGEGQTIQLFMAATKTHGFVCRYSRDNFIQTSLCDLSSVSVADTRLVESADWTGVIGDWPLLEARTDWQNVGGQSVAVEDASQWALHGMLLSAVKQWPEAYGLEMPEPKYMRLSTAEEKKQLDSSKERM